VRERAPCAGWDLEGTGRRRGHRGALLGQRLPAARARGRSLGAAATGDAGTGEPPRGGGGGAGLGEPLGAAAAWAPGSPLGRRLPVAGASESALRAAEA